MRFWFYIFKASWRIGMGRWYVWRDIPDDIVRQVAVMWYFNRRRDEEKSELIYEAYKEYKMRKARGQA